MTALAHLTCVNHTREQVGELLQKIKATGCRNILALRGDPPGGRRISSHSPADSNFPRSWCNSSASRAISASASPVFPKATLRVRLGKHVDWQHLKEKVDAGADFVFTQLFFDNADFFEFRDHLTSKLGVNSSDCSRHHRHRERDGDQEIHPDVRREDSAALGAKLDALGTDDAAAAEFGIEYATKQCEELLRAGVPGLHFYTLNKAASTVRVLKNLNLA